MHGFLFQTLLTIILFYCPFIKLHGEEKPCNPKKRILIASPIRQKPAILKQFLDSLNRLEQVTYSIDFFFIDDNDQLESRKILLDFLLNTPSKWYLIGNSMNRTDASDIYVCDDTIHYWTDNIMWKVARFKDEMINKARTEHYDYLFLIDSDIVLHPNTIEQLIKSNKDIISNIFWTRWGTDPTEYPQVWLYDLFTDFEIEIGETLSIEEIQKRRQKFHNMLRVPGVYEVGGLGACTLISQNALKEDISFKKIPNLTIWGEDRHFCIRALALGLDLHVDTHHPAYHIYTESYLQGVDDFINSCK
ncbi:MAG: hypothetical protein Q8K60_02480 [Parachlamydiaceae bacterium]|nr:hypothetical protein [Parachlamydiaceae bacterium]